MGTDLLWRLTRGPPQQHQKEQQQQQHNPNAEIRDVFVPMTRFGAYSKIRQKQVLPLSPTAAPLCFVADGRADDDDDNVDDDADDDDDFSSHFPRRGRRQNERDDVDDDERVESEPDTLTRTAILSALWNRQEGAEANDVNEGGGREEEEEKERKAKEKEEEVKKADDADAADDEKLLNCRTLGPCLAVGGDVGDEVGGDVGDAAAAVGSSSLGVALLESSLRFCQNETRKLLSFPAPRQRRGRRIRRLDAAWIAACCLFVCFFASSTPGVNSTQKSAVTSEDDALRYLSKFGYLRQPSQPPSQRPLARARSRNADGAENVGAAAAAGQTFSNLRLGPDTSWSTAPQDAATSNGLTAATTSVAASAPSVDQREDAIRDFQKMAGLPVTGVVDEATIAMMNMPRCGVKDKFASPSSRSKRYLLQGSKWRNKDLTYKISQYLPNLTKAQVDKVIHRAFKVWGDHSGLTFTQKRDGKVHINILFVSGEHGDGEPFDGKGGTLAHAYFPMFGGDAHFDADEVWTIQDKTGINLFIVAAHEIGHSLGLLHTDVREALMAPFYRGYTPNFRLHSDDIQAIQRLYGPPSSGYPSLSDKEDWFYSSYGTKPTKSTTIASNHNMNNEIPHGGLDICMDSRVDAMTRVADGSTYAFKNDYYWLVEDAGYARGYPRRISQDWDGLPGNLNAALTWRDGRTFFFKGELYWRFTDGKKMDKGYPKKISAGFAGLPTHIDAAFVWSGNGKTYFFKDGEYWRYGASTHGLVDPGYPKPLSVWEGLPKHINAAFQWKNGKTYFFAEDTYYRFNDKDLKVDSSFPRPVSTWWFGCGDISNSALMMPPDGEKENQSTKRATDESFAPWFWQGSYASALTSGATGATFTSAPRLKLKTKNVTDLRLILLSLLKGDIGLIFFLLSHVITPFSLIVVIS